MSDVTDIKTALASSNLSDRLRAVNQIRALPIDQGFELIQIAINDNNPRVRYAAVSQMDQLGHHDRARSLAILQYCLLEDSEADVQAAAADSLAALKLTEAFDNLATVFRTSSEWLVRFSIVAALGELGDPRGFELLREALASSHELERLGAVGSLGELGDPAAIELLLPLTSDPDWQIRYRLAQALGRFAEPAARSGLETLAADENDQVATEAKSYLTAR